MSEIPTNEKSGMVFEPRKGARNVERSFHSGEKALYKLPLHLDIGQF